MVTSWGSFWGLLYRGRTSTPGKVGMVALAVCHHGMTIGKNLSNVNDLALRWDERTIVLQVGELGFRASQDDLSSLNV